MAQRTQRVNTHGTQTFGFLIQDVKREISSKSIAYFPDTGPLPPEVEKAIKGIETLINDATFHGRNLMPQAHLSVGEATQLAQKLRVKKTYLTHLTMHYDEPITSLELQEMLAMYKGAVLAAHDGLELAF